MRLTANDAVTPRVGLRGPHLGIYGLNQPFDIPVAECVRLKLAGIVRMAGHVISANGISKLRVPKNAHDLGEIHVAFVGEDLCEIAKPAADVAHMDLIDLSALTEVLNNRKDFGQRVLQS